MNFCFGDIVVVDGCEIGVVVKCWSRSLLGEEPDYEIYVRSYNGVKTYHESDVQRYMVRHEYLNEQELEWQKNAILGR